MNTRFDGHTEGPYRTQPCSAGGVLVIRGDYGNHPQSHLQVVPAADGELFAAAPSLLALAEEQRKLMDGAQIDGFWSLDGKTSTHWVLYLPIKESERGYSIAKKSEEFAAALKHADEILGKRP